MSELLHYCEGSIAAEGVRGAETQTKGQPRCVEKVMPELGRKGSRNWPGEERRADRPGQRGRGVPEEGQQSLGHTQDVVGIAPWEAERLRTKELREFKIKVLLSLAIDTWQVLPLRDLISSSVKKR